MRGALNVAANVSLGASRRTMLEGGAVRNAFAGFSGQKGVLAHDMLEAGFCGELDGVAHVIGKVVSERFDKAAMTEALGARWEVCRNPFKLHACCRYNHAALDALEKITVARPLDPAEVASIEVESYGFAAEPDDPGPRNVPAVSFSLAFAIATTLVNRSSGVVRFTREMIARPDVLALAAKVSVCEDAMPDVAKSFDLGPCGVRLENLHHADLACRETPKILGHWRIRGAIDSGRVDAGTGEVGLKAHRGRGHRARDGDAEPGEVLHPETPPPAAAQQDERVACHHLAEADERTVGVTVVMQHHPHRSARRDLGAAGQQPFGRLGRGAHLHRESLARPVAARDGEVEGRLGNGPEVLVEDDGSGHPAR